MIKSRLFIRFAAVGILISGLFLVLSVLTTHWMRNLIFNESFRDDRGPFRSYEIFLDRIPPEERVAALKEGRGQLPPASKMHRQPPPPPAPEFMPPPGPPPDEDRREIPKGSRPTQNYLVDMILLDAEGKVLFPDQIDESRLGRLNELFKKIKSSRENRVVENDFSIRALSGSPPQFFARSMMLRPPPPPLGTLVILNSVQLVTIILAVLVTLAVVFYSLRKRAQQADAVMSELSRGNLKARIEISKMDEIGQTMFSFNKMADEIEHLIEHLRKTENARRDLLRELAHDLRTPVASLKSLIETVSTRSDQLPKEKIKDLLDLAMKEADYFEGLVDDLLFIGRVGEPKYKTAIEIVDFTELIQVEIEAISARYPKLQVDLESAESLVECDGDANLLKRLVRNALDNAASVANERVILSLKKTEREVILSISDDGPGFDATSLASFGHRKYSRAMTHTGQKRRISIGLGSVIMKSITDVHRGELLAENRIDPNGDILGAIVSIRLPTN